MSADHIKIATSRFSVGQIYAPTCGNGHSKVVVSVGSRGNVYAARYPRRDGVLPSNFSAKAWRAWMLESGAQWAGDAT